MSALSEGTGDAKTWASGRKLTPAERARKREVDRKTKAAARQREKQKVVELESQLAALTQRHVAQQSQVSELLLEVEMLKQENAKYRQGIGYLRGMARPYQESNSGVVVAGQDPSSLGGVVVARQDPSPLVPSTNVQPAPPVPWTTNPNAKDVSSDPASFSSVDTTIEPHPGSSGFNEQAPVDTTAWAPPTPTEPQKDNEIASRMIESARKVQAIPLSAVCLDDVENQDSLVRIILSGRVGKARNCPVLERMEETFDQCIRYCGTVERFVMLRLIHQMMLFQIARKDGHRLALPDWYKPRPVQLRVRHEEIADYFAWPSFRERLVFSLSAISRDDFWIAFAQNFQFCGPFPTLNNIVSVDSNGKYSFVPAFENDMRNFKYWRMRLDFFEQFPDLYDFMVPLEPMPKRISTPPFLNIPRPRSANSDEEERQRKHVKRSPKPKKSESSATTQAPQKLEMRYVISSKP